MENLSFKGGNPGAVQYGNFINYYQFHPPENRINVLPKDIWDLKEPFVFLDIGCNAGDLTISIYDFLTKTVNKPCYMLGIDIDPTLIVRANEKNTNNNIRFHCLDFMDEEHRNAFISEYLSSIGASRFSVSFSFSITMWIHLNNGDAGLTSFLEDICTLSSMIVIEPQPWKCYKTAVKRLKLSNEEFPQYNNLKIRDNVENEIETILIQQKNILKIKETKRTSWDRKILIFKAT